MNSWSELKKALKHVGREWAEGLFPSVCVICGRPAASSGLIPDFCPACLAALPWRVGSTSVLPVLSERLRTQLPHADFERAQKHDVLVPMYYSGPVPGMLRRLKFNSRLELAAPLGSIMAAGVRMHPLRPYDCLASVPLHPARMRERGYNQAGELAAVAASSLGLSDLSAGLTRVTDTLRQSELVYARRADNLRGAFQAESYYFARRHVLVADDILTSGATLWSVMDAVDRAGAASVTGLVLASGRKEEVRMRS